MELKSAVVPVRISLQRQHLANLKIKHEEGQHLQKNAAVDAYAVEGTEPMSFSFL